MRIITSFEKENLARRFSMFLQKEGVDNNLDVEMDSETKKFSYQVWVHDEDKVAIAQSLLEDFKKNPKDSKFDTSLKEVVPPKKEVIIEEKAIVSFPFKITFSILTICIFFYFFNLYQEFSIRRDNPTISYVLLTPIQVLLLFDVPHVLLKVDGVIRKYKIDPSKDIKKQSLEAYLELEKIDKMPFWRGIYEVILLKRADPKAKLKIEGPLFEKIRQGQVWRLFSPCLLHKDLIHLLFNMLWLWMLGKQVERRISKVKYLILILIVGVVSNISQYLMSGPYFLGYSGIIMGMVGFIWARQQVAPWEGYPLQKAVLLFLGIYVILMFILSFFSFVTQFVGLNLFAPNIANTAHIVGAIVGWILGRLPFFSWSPRHEC